MSSLCLSFNIYFIDLSYKIELKDTEMDKISDKEKVTAASLSIVGTSLVVWR